MRRVCKSQTANVVSFIDGKSCGVGNLPGPPEKPLPPIVLPVCTGSRVHATGSVLQRWQLYWQGLPSRWSSRAASSLVSAVA